MKTSKSISFLAAAFLLVLGSAACGIVSRAGSDPSTGGSVIVHGHAVKAIGQGPTVIHAYAAEQGARLYTVTMVTGSDSDCGGVPSGDARRVEVRPNRRTFLTIERGEMGCLATPNTRGFKFSWHAHVRKIPTPGRGAAVMASADQAE